MDLTEDPGNPTLWARHELQGGYIHDIYVKDNIGYASSGNNGFWVYDFSDPDTAIVLGTLSQYPEKGFNHSNWVSEDGNHLVFADETHGRALKMADISDFSNIQVVDLFRSKLLYPDSGSIAHNPYMRDNYVIASYYHDGVGIFNFSEPTDVQQVAWFDTEPINNNYNGFQGCWGVYPYLPSGRILASDIKNGLFVFGLDSIEFEPIFPTVYPDVELNFSDDLEICEDESVTFSADSGADNYQWFLNDSLISEGNPKLLAEESGTYFLKAENGHCQAISEFVELSVLTYPDATISEPADLDLCEGESIILTIDDEAENFVWYFEDAIISEDTNSISISQSGEYYATAQNGDCMSDSESVFLEVSEFPSDSLTIDGVFDLCKGETTTLTAFEDAENYEWFFYDSLIQNSGNSLVISEHGRYRLEASNGDCKTVFVPVKISVTEFPDAEISITGEPVYCEDDVAPILLVTNSPANIYQWFLNENSIDSVQANTLLIPEPGNYSAILTNIKPNGLECSDTSEIIEIIELPLPEIEIFAEDTALCVGDYTFIEATPGYENYVWFQNQILISNGDVTGFEIETGGNFQVQVWDGMCSNTSAVQQVLFFDPIIPEITSVGDTLYSTSASEYHWLLDGFEILQANDQRYIAFESGVYQVVTFDENGCIGFSNEIEIIISNTKNAISDSQIEVFPNPASENLFIQFKESQNSHYQLFTINSIGQILDKHSLKNVSNETFEMNISELESGIYFLKIIDGKSEVSKRFLKH